jgi:hypothetical protein
VARSTALTRQERAVIAEAKIRGAERAAAELIGLRAREVRANFVATFPHLNQPQYLGAIDQYFKALRREELIQEGIEELVEEKGAGAVRPLMWEAASKAARTVQQLGAELGLGPQSEARLRLLRAQAFGTELETAELADLAAEGHALRVDGTVEEEPNGDA